MGGDKVFVSVLVLLAAGVALTACSSDDADVRSFHYLETRTGNIDGSSYEDRDEGYYKAPDSARVISDAEYSPLRLEDVVIGSRTWSRDSSGWITTDIESACYTALDKAEWILGLSGNYDRVNDEGAGPVVSREQTRRYSWESQDAGKNFILASELTAPETAEGAEIVAQTKEVFGDLTGTWNFLVGEETGRVYSYRLHMTGARLTQTTEGTIEYDISVEIEPPSGVPVIEQPASDASDCGIDEHNFPWLPAATAAVLGPVLFLAASSFLWARRL